MSRAVTQRGKLDAAVMRARRAEWLRPRLDALPRPYQGDTPGERVAARAAARA